MTVFTAELAENICAEVATGETLPRVAAKYEIRLLEIYKWLNEYAEFAELYRQSIKWRAQTRYDELDELARDLREGVVTPVVGKTISDIMRWQCSKDDNERFGDKIIQQHQGKDGQMLEVVTRLITELPPSQDIKVIE